MLGDDPLTQAQLVATTSGVSTYRRAGLALTYYDTVRDATLMAHPWNFAVKRVELLAYCEPNTTLTLSAVSGTCVTFTVTSGLFTDLDVGKTIEPDTSVSGNFRGSATITMVTSCSTQAIGDVDNTFTTTGPIDCGSWRLFNAPPAFDYTRTIDYPTDALRIWRTEGERYAVEGQTIVTDEDTLQLRYLKQVTDTTLFPPMFVQAFTCHLAAVISEATTGQNAKYDRCWAQYQSTLKQARTLDGMEGTPERLRSRELIDVRTEGTVALRPWWWRR